MVLRMSLVLDKSFTRENEPVGGQSDKKIPWRRLTSRKLADTAGAT